LALAIELLEKPSGDRRLGADPGSGAPVILRAGRYGHYVQCGEGGDGDKPRTCSLLSTMKPDELTLEDALKLLSLPRDVGTDDEGVMITATTGRYGPYIARGSDRRTLASDDLIFTVTVAEAVTLLAQPRTRARRAPQLPLRELGADPVSGKAITLREGRFGPYVSDGETHASLRRGDTVDGLTPERAQELLAERRERAPRSKRPRRVAKSSRGSEAARAQKGRPQQDTSQGERKKPGAKRPAGAHKKRAPRTSKGKKNEPGKRAVKAAQPGPPTGEGNGDTQTSPSRRLAASVVESSAAGSSAGGLVSLPDGAPTDPAIHGTRSGSRLLDAT
jgi:DNA topoisomerase-1